MNIFTLSAPYKFSTKNPASHVWVSRVTDETRSLHVYKHLTHEGCSLEEDNKIFLGNLTKIKSPEVIKQISNFNFIQDNKLNEILHGRIKKLQEAELTDITVDIDYSSFTRRMVMGLADLIRSLPTDDCKIRIWYSRANYSENFPHYGFNGTIEQHGKIRITAESEMCVLGLGLDASRTYALWQTMDPSSCVAIYAKSPDNSAIVDEVLLKNREVLSSIDEILELPINDMNRAVSILVDLSREFDSSNDIVMVPDGPKPLMLAMALAVKSQERPGVYYRDVQIANEAEDILSGAEACGPIYGFCVS